MRPAHAALVGELEDALGARVERPVDRVAEARRPVAGGVDRPRELVGDDGRARRPRRRCACASSSSRAHTSAVPSTTGPQPRMPAATAPCSEPGIGGERHPRRDVRRHHPVLGDRDEEEVEEVALLLGRLAPGEQQVEVRGEA